MAMVGTRVVEIGLTTGPVVTEELIILKRP